MKLDNYQSFLDKDAQNARYRANWALSKLKACSWPEELLDVGCGNGDLLRLAKSLGVKEVKGIDGVKESLDFCRDIDGEIFNVDLNVSKFPLRDCSVDAVVCLEVLEHLYDPKKTLQEIFRVLRMEKIAVISVPNPFAYLSRLKILLGKNISDPSITGGHIKFFRSYDLSNICYSCGFKQVSIYSLPYPSAYKKYGKWVDNVINLAPDLLATWFFAVCQK